MGNSFLYRMGNGVAGDLTRQSQATTIEPLVLGATPFPGYGLFGKISSNKMLPVGAGDAAGAVYALLVRSFPTTGANASDPLGTSVPPTSGVVDFMRRGYAAVKVNAGTPAHGTGVFIRVANAAGGQPIGGIEAVADGANTIQVAGAIFMGAKDADNIAEIAFNI